MPQRVIDANLNRISEGLRVIEEYVRFISKHAVLTKKLAFLRQTINRTETAPLKNLLLRNTEEDMRACDIPAKRSDLLAMLKANFKRVQEGLRVMEEYTGDSRYNRWRYEMYNIEKEVLLYAYKPHIKPGIYLISDDVEVLLKGEAWGVSLIQLRDKEGTKEAVFNKASDLVKRLKGTVPFIVNDFLDIAMLLDTDGFHSGQDDLSVTFQRELLGEHKLIGRTTHHLEQGKQAEIEGADYVSVGPIWDTPSKPNRSGIGLEYLKQAQKQLSIPYVAIGGVNATSIQTVMAYDPPLVGLIRDYEAVPSMLRDYFCFQK